LAVVEIASGKVLLAIDRMGMETLAWGVGREGFAFGTSVAAVAAHLADSRS
jgi:hypothetical protein